MLKRSDIFAALSEAEREQLASRCELHSYPRGHVLVQEGDVSDAAYLILSGDVEISTTSSGGRKVALTVLGPGKAIGELTAIDGSRRSATATVVHRAQLLRVPRDPLQRLLEASPGAALRVAATLAGIVRRLTEHNSDLANLTLAQRLSKFLLTSADEAGAATFAFKTSQEGVANRLGVTRQTLNAALRSLVALGHIEASGRTVRILDRRALTQIVDGA